MARARNLKPGFFKNEDLAECTMAARLCFAGLWTLADRDGRLEDRPKRIKAELFAFDSIEVEPLLAELAKHGFILRYEAENGRGLIQVIEFAKHQNPHHREPSSDLPPPQSPGPWAVANKPKPEAFDGCHDAKARGQPEDSPRPYPPKDDLASGSSRAESGIDESGTLIPEKKPPRKRAAAIDRPDDVAEQTWLDWLGVRSAKRAGPPSLTGVAGVRREAEKAGLTLQQALETCCLRGWVGFEAEWLAQRSATSRPVNRQLAVEAENRRALSEWLGQPQEQPQ